MSAHSSILGGSNAQRLLTCPASYLETQRSPVNDVPSAYADEGTMLHVSVAECVRRKLTPDMIRFRWAVIAGEHTDEQLEALAVAIEQLEKLKAEHAGDKPWKITAMEETLPLPGVHGSFGSVDLILTNDVCILIIDWKFGAGVIVPVIYEFPDGTTQINAQAAYYACCGRAAYKRRFKDRRIILAVIQPRAAQPLSAVETDNGELDDFLAAFQAAVLEALKRDAHREKGEHCRFASCKATCPLWTGPVLDLSFLDPTKAALEASASGKESEFGAFLSAAMTMAEMAEIWAVEIRRQAHLHLEDGGRVQGWKLVPKRGTRQWVNEKEAAASLIGIGALPADIYTEPEFRSVAQAEKNLKKRGINIPAELHQTISTGTTLAHADDTRPEVTHGSVISQLRVALQKL